jgi:hypothetical protein
MTITLTREEAQQVLDALEQLDGWDTATQGDIVFDPSDEIEILCARLSEPEPPCKTGSQCIGGKCPQCVVREWQGLTDEEIKSLLWETRVDNLKFARVIEKLLREKNAS